MFGHARTPVKNRAVPRGAGTPVAPAYLYGVSDTGAAANPTEMAALPDGRLLYLVDGSPAALPAVRTRDLLHAWEAAHRAARVGAWGVGRLFRFVAADQACDIALTDPDASSWADAVDARADLRTRYGLALCLRLLALVDLLGRASWAKRLIRMERGEAELHPRLVAYAARTALNGQARFPDETLAAIGPACDLLGPTEGSLS